MEQMLTVREVAIILNIEIKSVYFYCSRKDNPLPHVRIGKHIRFSKETFEKWIKDQEEKQTNAI